MPVQHTEARAIVQSTYTWQFSCGACGHRASASMTAASGAVTAKASSASVARDDAQRIASVRAATNAKDLATRVPCPNCGWQSPDVKKLDRFSFILFSLIFGGVIATVIWLLGYVQSDVVKYGRFAALLLVPFGWRLASAVNRRANEDARGLVVFSDS